MIDEAASVVKCWFVLTLIVDFEFEHFFSFSFLFDGNKANIERNVEWDFVRQDGWGNTH